MKKIRKLIKIISQLILVVILSIPSQSQELYQTSKGHLFLSVVSDQNIIQKHFDNLKLIIDYENAKISWLIKDIDTNAISEINYANVKDTLKSQLLSLVFGSSVLEFSGQLSLEYIMTESHPPQYFDIEGMLIIGKNQYPAKGEGIITHIEVGDYACMLEMEFHNFTFLKERDGISQSYEVKLQIIQSLLKIKNSNY